MFGKVCKKVDIRTIYRPDVIIGKISEDIAERLKEYQKIWIPKAEKLIAHLACECTSSYDEDEDYVWDKLRVDNDGIPLGKYKQLYLTYDREKGERIY